MLLKNKSQFIHQAIDSYPGGICFANNQGRVILVNQQMNLLVLELTGHTLLNALTTWDDLRHFNNHAQCQKLENDYLPLNPQDNLNVHYQQLFFRLSNQQVWHFQFTFLDITTLEIKAEEVTSLYQLNETLYNKQQHLKALQKRQKELLTHIVQINKAKELLEAKMKIHDDFGQCLIATKQALQQNQLTSQMNKLKLTWQQTIHRFMNIPYAQKEATLNNELLEVSQLIGCHIHIQGEMPEDIKIQKLIYASIREALTNAVRHAQAHTLQVKITKQNSLMTVEISHDGKLIHHPIKEGNGLHSLRKRLEEEGILLHILTTRGVTLVLDIPLLKGDSHD